MSFDWFNELLIEWFLIECRKTKTNVTTLANQNRRGQSNVPIRSRSNQLSEREISVSKKKKRKK